MNSPQHHDTAPFAAGCRFRLDLRRVFTVGCALGAFCASLAGAALAQTAWPAEAQSVGFMERTARALTLQSWHDRVPRFLQYQPSPEEQFASSQAAQWPSSSLAGSPSLLDERDPFARASYSYDASSCSGPAAMLANHSPQSTDSFAPADQYLDPGAYSPCDHGVTSSKDGFFQKWVFTESFLYQGNFDDLGINSVETYGVFALPLPSKETPLLIMPGYGVHFLDGPDGGPFLPGAVHDAYLSLLWLGKINERWDLTLGVNPGVYSDFENVDSDAVRVIGRAILTYKWKPDVAHWVLGVVYLDREDVSMLPAAGLIWTPIDGMRYELIMPRPKLAHRFRQGCGFEDWLYLAGEFGGGSWQIEQPGGANTLVSIRDIRLIVGMEQKRNGGAGHRLELAWVFGREIEYSDGTTFEPDQTLMVRAGLTY